MTSGNEERDWTQCLQKVDSKWGEPMDCREYKDSYCVYLKNVCEETLDVKCAVQNTNKTWRIFDKEGLAPGDTIAVWSCDATGKYLRWVKKHNDREIIFPTNMEINKTYKD